MKIVKINDNLKINIEQIYSLEKTSNQQEINDWINIYDAYIKEFSENPPELMIDNNKIFKPEFGKINKKEDLEQYAKELDRHIISIINEKPIYEEKYIIILITGLKINVDKIIYDAIDKYLEEYYIN